MNKPKKIAKMNLQMFNNISIFDMVNAPEIAAYWEMLPLQHPPYLGVELWPNERALGTELNWWVGMTGAPQALQPSAFGARAIPRGRDAFDRIVMELAYFKESKYVDEKLRQELLKVMATGNQLYIDTVLTQIFNDVSRLVDAADVRREIMRMELLTTGGITVEGNGQKYTLDYGFPEEHIGYANVDWSDYENSNPLRDIRDAQRKILHGTGIQPTRAITNSHTLEQIVANKRLNRTINVFHSEGVDINSNQVITHLLRELNLEVVVYDHMFMNDEGVMQKFIPDGKFILLPPTTLGSTWFGTTPQEADLMASNVANVSIVDTGVSITTSQKVDPVTVETIVAMLSLPSYENIRQVFILHSNEKPEATGLDLSTLTVPKLRELAREYGVEFNSRTTKSTLIELIEEAQELEVEYDESPEE